MAFIADRLKPDNDRLKEKAGAGSQWKLLVPLAWRTFVFSRNANGLVAPVPRDYRDAFLSRHRLQINCHHSWYASILPFKSSRSGTNITFHCCWIIQTASIPAALCPHHNIFVAQCISCEVGRGLGPQSMM